MTLSDQIEKYQDMIKTKGKAHSFTYEAEIRQLQFLHRGLTAAMEEAQDRFIDACGIEYRLLIDDVKKWAGKHFDINQVAAKFFKAMREANFTIEDFWDEDGSFNNERLKKVYDLYITDLDEDDPIYLDSYAELHRIAFDNNFYT